MDETDPANNNVKSYAVQADPSPFDKILPKEATRLSNKERKITYLTYSGTTKSITLKKINKYHETIFNACSNAFQSEWFNQISDRSKPEYFTGIRFFFDWINQSGYQTEESNRYEVLTDYQAYQMNDRGLKRSPLYIINAVIREGVSCLSLDKLDSNYLETLVSLSTPTKDGEGEPVSLNNWFDLPWMRTLIGEQEYLQLESPSLLFKSFRVTIAATLLWLLEQRKNWKKSPVIEFDHTGLTWQYDWNRLLLDRLGRFNDKGEPEDDLSHLLWLDLVVPSTQSVLKNKLCLSGTKHLPVKLYQQKKTYYFWQRPIFFHPSNQTRYSPVEELLCAWLIACEAIQPNDIPKLKTGNYAREYNQVGRLIAMECTYYKGRSGRTKQPAILTGKDPWTRAMASYIEDLSGQRLFNTRVAKNIALSLSGSRNHICSFLYKIWKLPSFNKKLKTELQRSSSSSLFLRSMLALEQGDDFNQFTNQTGKSREEYRTSVSRPLPLALFTLTHIKTTAVHAGSDAYREADLINYHSHTSLTEKTSYLTDKNKEWVNQAHRITRLVIHDLQNVVFQPSITAIGLAVNNLELRTQVVQATNTQEAETRSLKNGNLDYDNEDTVVVSDTIDTALYFLHYITQAEEVLPKLLACRPDWVERTLVVQVEWMVRTLTRMRMASTARKNYVELADHLPRLFDHLLETTE